MSASFAGNIEPLLNWNYLPDSVNKVAQESCNPGTASPSNLILGFDNGRSYSRADQVFSFYNGLGVMKLAHDPANTDNYSYDKNGVWSLDHSVGGIGFSAWEQELDHCDLRTPDYVRFMIGECPIRLSPTFARPFYDTEIQSPFGQVYATSERPNYLGCYKNGALGESPRSRSSGSRECFAGPNFTNAGETHDRKYYGLRNRYCWAENEFSPSAEKVGDDLCADSCYEDPALKCGGRTGENEYMSIYSFVDDGIDPDLATQPYTSRPLKWVTGTGSIHFPNEGEGAPYISYEQNTLVKYEDGEVINGKIEFTDSQYDPEARSWQGTLEYPKRIAVEDPALVALERTFKYEISFTNDYSSFTTNSRVMYDVTERSPKDVTGKRRLAVLDKEAFKAKILAVKDFSWPRNEYKSARIRFSSDMTVEVDGYGTTAWTVTDAQTITIAEAGARYDREDLRVPGGGGADLVIEFDTDDSREFVGTFTAPEDQKGKKLQATEWVESLGSRTDELSRYDSFSNQFWIHLPKLKDLNQITTRWLYYSFYDYSPQTQGDGQLSKLPSCIWRSAISHSVFGQASMDSAWQEDEDPILCTTYEERMSKSMPFAADPSVFKDAQGDNWMVMGNFWNGIHVVQLDEEGKIKGMGDKQSPPVYTFVAKGPPAFSNDGRHDKGGAIGSASIHYSRKTGYYYLFATWKPIVGGKQASQIKVGRSQSPTGPFIDKLGTDMTQKGGTILIDADNLLLGGNFRLTNPKRAHHFRFKDTEWLSLQVNVAATDLMNEKARAFYKEAADPQTGLQELEKGKDQLGVYQLTWGLDGWPIVNLEKVFNEGCAKVLQG